MSRSYKKHSETLCTTSASEDVKQFLKSNPYIDNIDNNRKLKNIIIRDIVKIDTYEQIMMNVDIMSISFMTSFFNSIKHTNMKKTKPTLEEFSQMYPELLAPAREYAEGTIADPEEHDDAVESCVCDFMEGLALRCVSRLICRCALE